ncbi:GGDEF domain-containing protein [Algiphilus aromaticivorans]|uniref:GGDEF domain-containing protein n=1 Tax=Algiphilus aromaticivorans TaxID=382454 RepID=UPI0005C18026|nr:GGDEF domain-containing protein [Algiphilus aromaticivorans]
MCRQDEMAYSAELLRLTLPQMARHGSSMNPLNYALWYTFVAGSMPALVKDVRAQLVLNDPLTSQQVRSLFDQYINDYDIEEIRRVRSDLAGVVDTVARSTQESRAQTEAFEESLQEHVARLQQPQNSDELSRTLTSLISDTTTMRGNVGAIQQQLASTVQEIGRLQEALEQAREESLRDPLTGIANRRGFDAALNEALRADPGREDSGCCLLLVDIDHFKRVNDTYGHLLGDRVIVAVAKVLRDALVPGQTAARYGGEEFAIVMPDASRGKARALAERVRAEVARGRVKRRDGGEEIGQITISVGVCVPPVDRDAEVYMRTADEALYSSKANGRNCVTIFPPSASQSSAPVGARQCETG